MHSWLYGYYSTYQVVPNTRIQCTSSIVAETDARAERHYLSPIYPSTQKHILTPTTAPKTSNKATSPIPPPQRHTHWQLPFIVHS